MRSSIPAAAVILATLSAPAVAQGDRGSGYVLVWSDEFDGSALDLNNWDYMYGTGSLYGLVGWGNNELQYYTDRPENVQVSDGTLKIIARAENFDGQPYTSARIRTKDRADFLYGRIEGRIKLPSTSGVWPAFWMLPTNSPYGGWASSGEIDVMESVNNADRIYGYMHFGSPWPANQSNGNSIVTGIDYSNDFHVFAIEWEPDQVRWYLDGQHYHTVNSNQWFSSEAPGNPRAPFDVDFHMLLNVAVGGNFPGNPNGSAQYPQTMEVDYVRVFQVDDNQEPFTGIPSPIPGQIEAEDYDTGPSTVAYMDSDAGNNGSAYRTEDVDIETSSEGGFNVGWIEANEWLEYTVDVAAAGEYLLEMRVASPQVGGPFHVEFDGVNVTGTQLVPITGGYQTWFTMESMVTLDAGEQVMRFTTEGGAGNFNINWFRLTQQGVPCSIADMAEPFGTLNFFDLTAFLAAFNTQTPLGDLAPPFGVYNFFDVSAYLGLYNAGCP